ncbi:MAG: cupin domain-containing protein [Kineosporiaceae bacterium]
MRATAAHDPAGDAAAGNPTHDSAGRRVVVRPREFGRGAPMEVGREGVRDLKVIYPETGFDAATLCFGIVEIDPARHSPLHRHRCEEMYYVLQGAGEVEQAGALFPIVAGDAVLNRPDVVHRVHNRGDVTLRLAVVAGIMLVPLLAAWPTPSPYEILE